MSSSSSEEEMDEAFRESAGCDYINQMVAVPNFSENKKPASHGGHQPETDVSVASEASKRTTIDDGGAGHFRETGFEKFLANRLACRLDENIKMVERKSKSLLSDGTLPECGIRLFSGSPKVTELIETSYEQPVSPRKRHCVPEKNVDYKERAEEAAVSHQWVKDLSNTVFWKDNKKPRVLRTKVAKCLPSGGIECAPVSTG